MEDIDPNRQKMVVFNIGVIRVVTIAKIVPVIIARNMYCISVFCIPVFLFIKL